MTEDVFFSSSLGNLTLVLLVTALGIFVWLTARSRNIKSFQFQAQIGWDYGCKKHYSRTDEIEPAFNSQFY